MLTVTRPYPFPFAACSVYVSVILKFPLKGQYPVSTQDSKNFGRAGLGFLIPYTFYFVCQCWNSILFFHLLNVKCVFFRTVMSVLVVGGVACALKKSLAATHKPPPSPRIFTIYSAVEQGRSPPPHYAYVTVVLTKQMSVSKNKKQFAGSEKTNPTWEGEQLISGV